MVTTGAQAANVDTLDKLDVVKLNPIVAELLANPYRLATADELHIAVGRSINFVLAAKNAGAPFPGGVARPEWLLEWLKKNSKFAVKNHVRKPKGKK